MRTNSTTVKLICPVSSYKLSTTTTNWIKHEHSYPWPSWSTNISWYGNWRLRSFRISSTHLGSPSCAASCAYKFFFWSNSKFPPHKYSHARGRTEAGMPFLQRSRTCIRMNSMVVLRFSLQSLFKRWSSFGFSHCVVSLFWHMGKTYYMHLQGD